MTQISPEKSAFWPAEMKRRGEEATAHQMATAYRAWTGNLTVGALAGSLSRAGVTKQRETPPLHGIAEVMIQRARMAGYLEWDGRKWSKTTPDKKTGEV